MSYLITQKDTLPATQLHCFPPSTYKHADTLAWNNTYTYKKRST